MTLDDDSGSDDSLGSRSCIQSFSVVAEEFIDGEYQSLTSPKILVDKIIEPDSLMYGFHADQIKSKKRTTKSHEQASLQAAYFQA